MSKTISEKIQWLIKLDRNDYIEKSLLLLSKEIDKLKEKKNE